jgi:hypothetical protein
MSEMATLRKTMLIVEVRAGWFQVCSLKTRMMMMSGTIWERG